MFKAWAVAVVRSLRRNQVVQVSILFCWVFFVLVVYNHGNEHTEWAKHSLENQVNNMMQKVNDLQDSFMDAPEDKETGDTIVARPFHQGEMKQVILLSYNRCGSTFMGQIFNRNPQAFYMYEPIDAIYTAMYGTAQGWNVASDIFSYANGSVREMPRYEVDMVSDVLGKMLSCEFDDIPTEILINRFWGMFYTSHERLLPFIRCLKQHELKGTEKCRQPIKPICALRFGGDYQKMMTCKEYMMDGRRDGKHAQEFREYGECMAQQRKDGEKCIQIMKEACESSYIRSTKTVRMTMAVGETLLRKYRNMRIIHLVRDPRAVALSRMTGHSSYRGLFSHNEIVKEAEVFCTATAEDVRRRKKLEVMFPGSTMQMIYEHFVSDPRGNLQLMYQFLNTSVPSQVSKWLEVNTEELRNSSRIAAKWQDKVTFKVARLINEVCSDLYDEVSYRWP